MSETLKFGNGQWAVKKGSTLAYNDENGNFKPLPFTFDRSTSATRVNKEGLIEVVSNNEPRIDFLNDSKGALLLEPSRSNLIPYSEDFTKLTKTNTIITSNQAISPNGTLNADELTGSGFARAIYAIGNGDITVSCYVKSNDGTDKNFVMGAGSLGSIGNETFTATSEWQRFTHTFSTTAQSTDFGFFSTGGVDLGLYLYGFQLEQGYPTSYIPTQGSIGTRDAESCSDAGNEQVFNDSEGVLFAEISAFENLRLGVSENSSTVNRVLLGQNPNGDVFSLVTVGSSPIYTYSASGFSLNENIKVALKYKESDFALWVNGIEVDNQQSGITFSSDTLNVLDFTGQGADFYGKTKELQYFDTALSDAELQALTKI